MNAKKMAEVSSWLGSVRATEDELIVRKLDRWENGIPIMKETRTPLRKVEVQWCEDDEKPKRAFFKRPKSLLPKRYEVVRLSVMGCNSEDVFMYTMEEAIEHHRMNIERDIKYKTRKTPYCDKDRRRAIDDWNACDPCFLRRK